MTQAWIASMQVSSGMLDHVALLVPSIDRTLMRLGTLDATVGNVEEFPSEGTRELYVGTPGQPLRLMLVEPTSQDGPYAKAIRKRGPGLHHAAFRTTDFDGFFENHRGWLLHPRSLQTHAESATVWLARPGLSLLIEVFQNSDAHAIGDQQSPVVSRLSVPAADGLERLLEKLGLEAGAASIEIEGTRHEIDGLVS